MLRDARGIKNEHANPETRVKDLETKVDLCVNLLLVVYETFKPKDI